MWCAPCCDYKCVLYFRPSSAKYSHTYATKHMKINRIIISLRIYTLQCGGSVVVIQPCLKLEGIAPAIIVVLVVAADEALSQNVHSQPISAQDDISQRAITMDMEGICFLTGGSCSAKGKTLVCLC